jgi:CubicO group peptidase (beta-lactamase class C family)
MKYFFLLLSFCTIRSAAQYAEPVFTDAQRLQKIQATIPLLDSLFTQYAMQRHFPGFAYGLIIDGKLVHTSTLGYTDISKQIRVTPQSVFRVASMSKSFTAMAILKLRDEGKLRLDDPASKYIPQMAKLKYLTNDAAPITVRHLLTHAAGFPEDNPWGDRQLADTDAELMKLIEGGVSFSNVPGVAYEYSNLGFALLGRIVTNVSGKPYQQYITENILKPLGMNNSYWEYTKVPAQQLAHGYRWINEQWREEALLHDGSYGAMGGLMSSIEDFAKYVALHMSATPPRNAKETRPVKRSSLREMQMPWNFGGLNANYRYPNGRACAQASAYAYGLVWSKDCQGRVGVGHSGGLPGFGSQWSILPDYGIGIVSFANVTYAGTGGFNVRALDTIIALTGIKPREIPASAILNQRKEQLVKLLPGWNGAEKSGIFAENFFPDYPIDSLKKQAATLFAKAGKISGVGEMQAQNQLRGTFLLKGENNDIMIYFTLTPETPALIQEFRMAEVRKGK